MKKSVFFADIRDLLKKIGEIVFNVGIENVKQFIGFFKLRQKMVFI